MSLLGKHECTFRLNGYCYDIFLGVIPASAASSKGPGTLIGYEFRSNGDYYATRCDGATARFGKGYGSGDAVTICLDLDSDTVAVRVNGEAAGDPQKIPHCAYYFEFDTYSKGAAATIEEML